MKPKLLVSACLLGTPCRYDGKSKKNEAVCALAERFELIPVCPEVLGGLPTPRTPSERRGACVVRKDGRDVTAEYRRGAECALETARYPPTPTINTLALRSFSCPASPISGRDVCLAYRFICSLLLRFCIRSLIS